MVPSKVPMAQDVSIKEFRQNIASYAERVENGESFRVLQRSKPVFYVMGVENERDQSGEWETIADFTEGGKKKGVLIDDLIRALREADA